MRSKVFKVVSTLMWISWMLLIFSLSSETAAESSATSGGLSRWFFSLVYPPFNEMTELAQAQLIGQASFIVRKTAHFALYTVLGVLSSLSVISWRGSGVLSSALGWILSVTYAATDEVHQLYVSGRSGEVRDVFIDSLGSLTGVLFVFLVYSIHRRRKGKGHMRKSELMRKYLELTSEMQGILSENVALLNELNSLKNDNSRLKKQVSALKAEENTADSALPVSVQAEKESVRPVLSPETEYAASVIGSIVLSAAEYSNKLSADGDPRCRELINMILGRTEVEKGNILEIVLSDASIEDKKRMIDTCKNASEEYFESVMAQI